MSLFRPFQHLRLFLLTGLLCACLSFPASAAYEKNSGDLQPATYLFALALHAHGLSVTEDIEMWFDAYGFYLEAYGDSGARSRLSALKSLSWSGTFSQMDQLYADVHAWITACSQEPSGRFGSPMTAASQKPLDWVSSDSSNYGSIQTTPYAIQGYNQNPLVTSGEYEYLFSEMYYYSGAIYKRNIFKPKGASLFGAVSYHYPYSDKVNIQFYIKDNSSAGYSQISLPCVTEWYDANTHALTGTNGSIYQGSVSFSGFSAKWLANLPFPVMEYSIAGYLKGDASAYSLSQKGRYPIVLGGVFKKRIFTDQFQVASMSSSVALPASASAGKTVLASIAAASAADTRKALAANAGLTLTWVPWSYEVSYYYDGSLQEQQSLEVSPDENTIQEVPQAETYGYRLTDSPYTPKLPTDITKTDNAISVFYESWEYPYTVNYYYGSTLQDSVSLSVPSYANTVSEVPLLTDSGIYQLRDSPYAPELPVQVDADTNVIAVYYSSPVSESVASGFGRILESLQAFVAAAIPYALGVLGLTVFVLFILRIYRRIASKS